MINDGETPENFLARRQIQKAEHKNGNGMGTPLAMAAQMWGTPTTQDWKDEDAESCANVPVNGLLGRQAALWSTPRATDGEKGGPNQSFGAGGTPLPAMAAQWQTPSVADTTGSRKTRSGDRSNEMLLNGQSEMISRSIHRDQTTSTHGERSSNGRRSLNPLFVEWLMGWPEGWTAFACSATALTRYRRHMRSALFALGLPDDPPAQPSFFG